MDIKPSVKTAGFFRFSQAHLMIYKKNILCLVLAAFGFALLSLACKTRHVKTEVKVPEEKTAFYTISLIKDTVQHQTKAMLKNMMVTDVKINYRADEAKTKEPNFLKISIIYKNNKTVEAYTEHPLYRRFDLYSESGQIESKLISLQQGEVVVRVPYFDTYKKIIITEVVNFKEAAPIILKNEK